MASENRLKFTTFGIKDNFITVPDGFQQDAWQHVAVSLNTDSQATFYFNGQRLGTVDGPAAARYTADNFFIGRTGVSEPFQGMIDEVAIWSGVLKDSDVAALANGAKPNAPYTVYPRVNPYVADVHTALLYHLNSASTDYSRDAADIFIGDASGNAQHMQTEIGSNTYSPFTSVSSPTGLGVTASPVPAAAKRVFRNEAQLDLLSTSEFTIEAWIRNPLEVGTGGIFWAGHLNESFVYDKQVQFAVTGVSDQLQLAFIDTSGLTVSYTSTESLAFADNTWYHVAVTYEGDGSGSDSIVRFFATAFGEEAPVPLGLDILANDVMAFAGGDRGTMGIGELLPFSGDFGGDIDEVRWSNVARTAFNLTVTAPEMLQPGDANGDGKVDELDASILAANWLRTGGATWAQADFNGDGNVDDLDASILAANWQYGASSAVPEPSGVALLAGLILLLLGRRPGRKSMSVLD